MPAGPTLLGIGYYCAVKAAGYTLAAKFLEFRSVIKPAQNSLLIGITRTFIGVTFGMTVLSALALFTLGSHSWVFFTLLVPIRIAEWLLLFALFYGKSEWSSVQKFKYACLGVLWSFALDIPTFLAVFKIPGGFWVC
jgi:hypothetical protein